MSDIRAQIDLVQLLRLLELKAQADTRFSLHATPDGLIVEGRRYRAGKIRDVKRLVPWTALRVSTTAVRNLKAQIDYVEAGLDHANRDWVSSAPAP